MPLPPTNPSWPTGSLKISILSYCVITPAVALEEHHRESHCGLETIIEIDDYDVMSVNLFGKKPTFLNIQYWIFNIEYLRRSVFCQIPFGRASQLSKLWTHLHFYSLPTCPNRTIQCEVWRHFLESKLSANCTLSACILPGIILITGANFTPQNWGE